MIKTILLLTLFATAILADESQAPRWNDRFTQDFEETFTYPVIGTSKTNGRFFYDWQQKKYAVYRENGKRDRYCGLNGLYFFYNTPCTQYVDSGNRYLYYPEYDYCCNCCQSAHGCGILKPDWLAEAEFIGEVSFNNQLAYKWDKPGLQSNFYYETVEEDPLDRVMLGIDQQPNDFQVFDHLSFSTEFPSEMVTPPPSCHPNNTCSFFSICTLVRNV